MFIAPPQMTKSLLKISQEEDTSSNTISNNNNNNTNNVNASPKSRSRRNSSANSNKPKGITSRGVAGSHDGKLEMLKKGKNFCLYIVLSN